MSDSTGKTLGIMGHKFRAVKTRTNRHLRVSKTQGDIKHRWETGSTRERPPVVKLGDRSKI